MLTIPRTYNLFLKTYGPQGWWPYFAAGGYHPGDYSTPVPEGQFEIWAGAVLTQNTSWKNVSKALDRMRKENLLSPQKIISAEQEKLAETIRASGYYNQKAKKLKIISEFIIAGGYDRSGLPPGREDLLALWGIGPETADSILLYAYNIPVFVVDAYTKRIFSRLGLVKKNASYDEIQLLFTGKEIKDPSWANEYHALIVKHAVERCTTKPDCTDCPLKKDCCFSPEQ